MSKTLTDARAWIRDYARNAGDISEYPAARIDRALSYVGTEFVKFTRCTRTVSTKTLAASNATVDTSAMTNFRPEYLIGDPIAWITVAGVFTDRVEVVALAELFEKQLHCPQTAAPADCRTFLAFQTNNADANGAIIYPTPDSAATYTLNLMWYPPFTGWTVGTGSPDGVTFNIPDEYLIPLLTLFTPRALQHNEPEHIYAADRDAEFMAYCAKCSGSGGLGVRSIQRESTTMRRARGF